ncbi:MAG TPA: hypothetical protein VH369_09630 [Bryobacteraceae bacterium]|jgi:hypothetical protein
MLKKLSFGLAACALTMTSLATASVLTPGSSGAPDPFSNAGWTLLATTGSQALSTGTFTANATASVYSDSANTFCSGCLDFVYMVTRTGGNDPIERITAANFAGYMVDAGVVTSSPGFAPDSVNRSADGGVIGFNYLTTNLTGTDSTQLLVIQTNATNYMAGMLSVQDGQTANGVGFQPAAATPEPVSMTLLGGGLALLGGARLRKKNKKDA